MPLLMLQDAQLAFGDQPLLDHVNLSLETGDRLGVIGRNGAGKSSLLKVLAGQQYLDAGQRVVQQDVHWRYVPQESQFSEDATIEQVLRSGLSELEVLLAEFDRLSQAVAVQPDDATLLQKMHQVQVELDHRDGWRLDAKLQQAMIQLGMGGHVPVAELSGGWKKRLAVAQALIASPNVLLLDEPTNHLDVEGIEVLEQMLKRFNGAVVVISHDRRFLDNVVTGLLELDRGILRTYPGSFTAYQQRKAEELASEAVTQALFDKFLAQEEVWIRKGIEARRTRNEGRVRRLDQLRRDRAERRERQGMATFKLDAGKRSGALVAELEGVNLVLDGWTIFKDVSTLIQRGDKVGLIGPNGVGKTTLIKLLLGEIQPDSGKVRTGTQLQVAYLDQQRAVLKDDDTILDAVREGSDYVEVMGQKKHILGYLEDFLFPPHRARVKVGSLSGGERARLLLAKLFTKPANLLILDEPTNDLDLETLELLESLLQNYTGTVLLVSHDRSFLDNVVTQSLCFVGDGRIIEVAGGYEEWLAIRDQYQPAPQQAAEAIKPQATIPPSVAPQQPVKKAKLSYKEQKELDALPDLIASLEVEQAELGNQLSDSAIFSQPDKLKTIQTRLQALDLALEQAMARWTLLEEKS